MVRAIGWRCRWCESEFYEPDIRYERENLDGERGWATYTVCTCPQCGSDDIKEIADDGD